MGKSENAELLLVDIGWMQDVIAVEMSIRVQLHHHFLMDMVLCCGNLKLEVTDDEGSVIKLS